MHSIKATTKTTPKWDLNSIFSRAALAGKAITTLLAMGAAICSVQSVSAASVRNFGAKGDGQSDDTAALQRAIDGTSSGSLKFPAGVYKISKTLYLRSNVTYSGDGDAVLKGTDDGFIMALPGASPSNITITGFTFDRGGITGETSIATNINISGNTFQNVTTRSQNWTLRNAIFTGGSFRKSSIDHNSFKNILPAGSTRPDGTGNSIDDTNIGITAYGLDATRIEHNTFDYVGQGIKVCFSQAYPTSDVYIGENVMTHMHRMGMELQGAGGCNSKLALEGINTENIIIESNKITDWIDPYWNSFGISFADPAPNGASGVVVRNNYIIAGKPSYYAQEGPSGKNGYGLEVSGLGLEVYGNVLAGYSAQSISVIQGSTGAQIHDNYACALEQGPRMDMGQQTGPSDGARYFNNIILSTCPAVLPQAE